MKTPYKPLETLLEEYGEIIRPIKGISMLPMLREDRDAVRLVPVKEDLKVGDVPLYRKANGQYVLHRIVSVEQKHYIIRGDNTYQLERVPDEWIVGVMVEFWRGKKHYTADHKGYRRYAAFWQTIYPIRAFFHRLRMIASRVKHKILK
jgi:acid phosphatase class B